MITLEVDGKQVEIEQGSSLIQACEKAGASIPRCELFFSCALFAGPVRP